jgi:16S rRNA (guanine527-N7)-methyltransferase
MNTNWSDRIQSVQSRLTASGVIWNDEIHQGLARYLLLLERWNRAYNLTGIPQKEWVDRIVCESAEAAAAIPGIVPDTPWIDLGSGAGIPGLIIGILYPHQSIHLLDSRMKRTDFLAHAVSQLQLNNIHIIRQRIENYTKGLLAYTVAFARALAPLPVLLRLTAPLLKAGGYLIVPGGRIELANTVLSEDADSKWVVHFNRERHTVISGIESFLVFQKRGETE